MNQFFKAYKTLFSLVITIAIFSTQYQEAESIYCYVCNSNWAACGENPDYSAIQYNKEPCYACATWKVGNIIYRGCSYEPKPDKPTSIINSDGVQINFCYTELCNFNLINAPTIKPTTTTVKPVATTTTVKPVATTTTVKPVATTTTVKPVATTTTVKPVATTTTVKPVATTQKGVIYCYECNARWAACGNPPNLDLIQYNKVQCNGACVTYNNPFDNNLLYRGCVNEIVDGKSGTYTSPEGVLYNYCSSNLCNVGGGAGVAVTTTTKAPAVTTTVAAPVQTTTAGSGVQTTAQSGVTVSESSLITYNEFVNAVTKSGYPAPSYEKYTNYVTQLQSKGGITTKREAAMFLAEIMWESDGLRATAEYACVNTGCPGVYGSSQYPGKEYYGRGYIQLSWPYNYGPCSQDLYGDDRLLRDPDQVATNDEVAWATAFWYWKTRVGTNSMVKNGYFGSATNAINGGLECAGPYQDKARKRFEIYKIVMQQYNINETPIENGCYN